ncbi:hypothetical protein D3C81_2284600 [compost metagenome]
MIRFPALSSAITLYTPSFVTLKEEAAVTSFALSHFAEAAEILLPERYFILLIPEASFAVRVTVAF